jgi:GAF domain-containing protein
VVVNRDTELAQVLAEFAHTLGTDFSIQSTLDHLVERIVRALPVTGAGVMVMGGDNELHFVSASNPTILEIESLQNELGEGPCLTAYKTGEAVAVPDLSDDERYPQFSPRAYKAGLAARTPWTSTATVPVTWTAATWPRRRHSRTSRPHTS